MPINDEPIFNQTLARVLWTRHPRWRHTLAAEQSHAVKGGGKPDLILSNPHGAPVVIETEYFPAATVERDAINRLGATLRKSGMPVEQCFALRAPKRLKHAVQSALDDEVAAAQYDYCLVSLDADGTDHVRWPRSGWLSGSIDDLASLLENASISERVVAQSLFTLEDGISDAAGLLQGAVVDHEVVNTRSLCLPG